MPPLTKLDGNGFAIARLRDSLPERLTAVEELIPWLRRWIVTQVGPRIDAFDPADGPIGTMVTIEGYGFSDKRAENVVTIGGQPALVATATTTEITAIVAKDAITGPIEVTVESHSAVGPADFRIIPFPGASAGDGPPISFAGEGEGGDEPLSAQGTINALTVLCYAQDEVPPNLSADRDAVIDEFNEGIDYYDQVSYGDTDLTIDYTNWQQVSGDYTDYIDVAASNFYWPAGVDRICAEAAQVAVDQNFDLDDYTFMAVVLYRRSGTTIRAYGGFKKNDFTWSDGTTTVSNTASHDIYLTTIGHTANYGRFCHELAHSIVDAGAVLGEDIYASGLIDQDVASARLFDLMGSHDTHPSFSAHFMKQLEYWKPGNIKELTWSRNPFPSESFTLVAHGSTRETQNDRFHAIEISVGAGVFYYVEVRQLLDPATSKYDEQIPIGGSANGGGVIVSKVFTDQVNINQEMRFLTLLHDPVTQDVGAVIEDPERDLKITVGSVVQTNPLTMNVAIEWAQSIGDTPGGSFDLSLSQTGLAWVSDDIWVDRPPWGVTDETDPSGNPVASREKPKVGTTNRLYAKVHNSGPDDAADVKLTYYAISPPGVGDNGAWAPIAQRTITSVSGGGDASEYVNWTPPVDDHTCLKVHASAQFGEVSVGNNQAQENVFYFEPAGASPVDAAQMKVAIRNPLDEETIVAVDVSGVPKGYAVHLPHSWVRLPAKGERTVTLTVIPFMDLAAYQQKERIAPTAGVKVAGAVARDYTVEEPVGGVPPSRLLAIGGITANVSPKHRSEIRIESKADKRGLRVYGSVQPDTADQQCIVRIKKGRRVHWFDVVTDSNGQFELEVGERELREPLDGSYVILAEVHGATALAPSTSNKVVVDVDA